MGATCQPAWLCGLERARRHRAVCNRGHGCLRNRFTSDSRIPQTAYAPTFVRSLAMVPVGDPAVAAIGAYWATEHDATRTEVRALTRLADATAAAIERVGLDEAPWAPNFSLT